MSVAQELIVNLYRVRGNAARIGRDDIVTVIDRYLAGVVSSGFEYTMQTPEGIGHYRDTIKAASGALWEIYDRECRDLKTVRELFAGYKRIEDYHPTSEFENYRQFVEPAILRDVS